MWYRTYGATLGPVVISTRGVHLHCFLVATEDHVSTELFALVCGLAALCSYRMH